LNASRIPAKLSEAFYNALLFYSDWSPPSPERTVRIGGTHYSMSEVCGLGDKFSDTLPLGY